MSTKAVILPAAGTASRIGGIPKFLLPDHSGQSLLSVHVEAASGVGRVIVVTQPSLVDFCRNLLPRHVELVAAATATMSQTVSVALEYGLDLECFAVGLPDTYTSPPIDYSSLLAAVLVHDISVAVYPTRTDQQGKLGAVRVAGGVCTEVRDKDSSTAAWGFHWGAIAFRRSVFSRYSRIDDPHVGYALSRAVSAGVAPLVAHYGDGYYDLGTPDELRRFWAL